MFAFGFLYYTIYINQILGIIGCYLYSNLYHYIFLNTLNSSFKNLIRISDKPKHAESRIIINLFNIFKTTLVEMVTIMICNKHQIYNIRYELLTFIPKSFIFEIIFDFFHYWTHRISHHKYLYYFHKTHHTHTNNISVFSTYNHSVFDLLFTNALPMYLTSYLITLSEVNFFIFLIFKTFIEISGHAGAYIRNSSFIQCSWIPKVFGIELYSKDHYIHHDKFNYNYAKRFVIWDKIFGTYKIDDEIIKKENILFDSKIDYVIKNEYVRYSLLVLVLGACYLI
jgi:sterol desaturase/sphingolipid hydroxylase (fatty acid hydroxylase superfamily)